MIENLPDSFELHVGVEAINFPLLFSRAQKHIFLHAGIYNRFAENVEIAKALRTALSDSKVQLRAILLPDNISIEWVPSAYKLLRPQLDESEMLERIATSRTFFSELASEFPDQVAVVDSTTFTSFPLVIVDERILAGQYAHSRILAPQGLWIEAKADVQRMMKICSQLYSSSSAELQRGERALEALSPAEKAVFRYVEEWHAALADGVPCIGKYLTGGAD